MFLFLECVKMIKSFLMEIDNSGKLSNFFGILAVLEL